MADNNKPVETGETQETVAGLKVIIVGMENDKAAQDALIAELQATLNTKDGLIVVLTNEKDVLAGELSQAETLLGGQKTTIDELTSELDSLKANPSSVPVITVDKVTYEVHATSFQYRDPATSQPRTYTVAELLKDKKLQAALVKKGMGFLVERQ